VRLLIVKRDKLGDLLLTLPVLERLHAALPRAELHLLANDYNAWVASAHPALTRTWVYPRVRDGGRLRPLAALAQLGLGWSLRRARFDAALVMGGDESPRAIRRALGTRARRVVAYPADGGAYGAGLTDALPVPAAGHEIDRMLGLLRPLGVAPPAAPSHPAFTLARGIAAFAPPWLTAHGLSPRRYAVIGLGARRAKKQPEPAQVLRWSEHLWREHGLATVFMWTPGARSARRYPGDDALAQAVLARAPAHLHPFRGPIDQALALIYEARVSILPDSGLMHFAAASPGGVLGLFADPADSAPAQRWAPRGPRAAFLEAPRQVSELSDEAVFAALAPLLADAAATVA
jgi:ADP-heptose:LPS heptosyltransferase